MGLNVAVLSPVVSDLSQISGVNVDGVSAVSGVGALDVESSVQDVGDSVGGSSSQSSRELSVARLGISEGGGQTVGLLATSTSGSEIL